MSTMTILEYIQKRTAEHVAQQATASTGGSFRIGDKKRDSLDVRVVARAVASDFARAEINVNADLTDRYKKEIDKLVEKMHAKRTPLNERVVVPYNVKLGDHDKSLQALKDPDSGEPLLDVVLAKNRRALFNPATRVVHPIPVKA